MIRQRGKILLVSSQVTHLKSWRNLLLLMKPRWLNKLHTLLCRLNVNRSSTNLYIKNEITLCAEIILTQFNYSHKMYKFQVFYTLRNTNNFCFALKLQIHRFSPEKMVVVLGWWRYRNQHAKFRQNVTTHPYLIMRGHVFLPLILHVSVASRITLKKKF